MNTKREIGQNIMEVSENRKRKQKERINVYGRSRPCNIPPTVLGTYTNR
jgi:hypothetical protein